MVIDLKKAMEELCTSNSASSNPITGRLNMGRSSSGGGSGGGNIYANVEQMYGDEIKMKAFARLIQSNVTHVHKELTLLYNMKEAVNTDYNDIISNSGVSSSIGEAVINNIQHYLTATTTNINTNTNTNTSTANETQLKDQNTHVVGGARKANPRDETVRQ